MLRLSRLARLSTTLNVRYTTPGHAGFLDRAHFIDPTHPATNLNIRNLPAFFCPQFTLRAFPHAILHEPVDFVPVNPLLATDLVRARKSCSNLISDENVGHKQPKHPNPDARRHAKYLAARQLADAHTTALAARHRRTNLSLLFRTPKKATSKSSVVRRRLRSKMTAAIDLVVTRNADAVPAPDHDKPRPPNPYPHLNLVSRPPGEDEPLVHQGWTYLVTPDITLYRMPLPNLVQVVRQALSSISRRSTRLEASWSTALANPTPGLLRNPPVHRQRRRPHEVVDKHPSAMRTRMQRAHRLHPFPQSSAEPVQGSNPYGQPAKHQRMYSDKPVIFSREKPKGKS